MEQRKLYVELGEETPDLPAREKKTAIIVSVDYHHLPKQLEINVRSNAPYNGPVQVRGLPLPDGFYGLIQKLDVPFQSEFANLMNTLKARNEGSMVYYHGAIIAALSADRAMSEIYEALPQCRKFDDIDTFRDKFVPPEKRIEAIEKIEEDKDFRDLGKKNIDYWHDIIMMGAVDMYLLEHALQGIKEGLAKLLKEE